MNTASQTTELKKLEKVYNRCYQRIYRFTLRRVYRPQAAEDITSTVFLKVAGHVGRFNGTLDKQMDAWVYKIAVNTANEWLRKNARQQKLLEDLAKEPPPEPASENIQDRETWNELYTSIARLPLKDQTLVTLRFFEDMTYDQIFEITGMKPSVARVRVHRALQNLKIKMRST